MFQNFGNLFWKTIQKPGKKDVPTISQEDQFLINMFSQNLSAFSTISHDSSCVPLFIRLINQFSSAFKNITAAHLNHDEIKSTLENYSNLCSEVGILLLHDKSNTSEILFNSLQFTSSLFGFIPNCASYFQFFCAIIQEIKRDPQFIDQSQQFLFCLFRSPGFFPEFVVNDGFSLIFSSFFLQDTANLQEYFLKLLFKTISMEQFKNPKVKSKFPNFKLIIDLLSHQSNSTISLQNSCLFISYYIIAFLPSFPTLLEKFNSADGFSILNHIFINISPETAYECYEIMMIESNLDSIVISNMNKLFLDNNTPQHLRSSLIPLLSVQTKNMNETYQKMMNAAPLTTYIVRPPLLDKNSLISLSTILRGFINNSNLQIDFKQFLSKILDLVSFPENQEIPADSYYQIILDMLNNKKITYNEFTEEKFFQRFLFDQSIETIASYYQHYQVALELFSMLYMSDSCKSEIQNQILLRFLQAFHYITDYANFTRFISTIVNHQFTQQTFRLLLINIEHQQILNLLTEQSQKNQKSFDFFFENDGFSVLNTYLKNFSKETKKDPFVNLMKFISSLSFYSSHEEIDEWLNQQPIDSKLFLSCSSDFLGEIGCKSNKLHIPSLLPFIQDFDSTSQLNLYLAGKFGVSSCLRRNIALETIPHIKEISNRYVTPDISKLLFNTKPTNFVNYFDINMPQFPVFEFIPLTGPSYITYKQQFASVSFWYYAPHFDSHNKIQIMHCTVASLIICDNETILAKTTKGKLRIQASTGKWHHVVVIFHMRRNIAYKCEFIIDKQHVGFVKLELQSIPSSIVFGHIKKPLPVSLELSDSIIFSENMLTDDLIKSIYKLGPSDINMNRIIPTAITNVAYVHYLGFSSYFRTSIQIERLFSLLEKVGHENREDDFKAVYKALLNLQSTIRAKFRKFWGRMILSFCRCNELINESLSFYACDYLSAFCINSTSFNVTKRVTTAIYLILSIIDIYFVFSYNAIKHLFDSIIDCKLLDWKQLEKFEFVQNVMTVIRSGIEDNFKLLFIPIITKLIQNDPTPSKLNPLFNSFMSLCDWTFDTVDLFHDSVAFSELQYQLLLSFSAAAKMIPDYEYPLNQLLMYMMLFMDERSIILADLIAFYSARNPKYIITPNNILNYVFQILALRDIKIWKIAFSILSGVATQNTFVQGFHIKRPVFVSVILDMLTNLTSVCSHSLLTNNSCDKSSLLQKVLNVVLSLDHSQFALFSQPNSLVHLQSLIFLGIQPNSYSDEKGNRIPKNWTNFPITQPTKAEIKQVLTYTAQSSLFTTNIPDNLNYEPVSTILEFPDDIENTSELTFSSQIENEIFTKFSELLKDTHLLDFFVLVIVESENCPILFVDLINGNSLIYNSYHKWITKEIIYAVLDYSQANDLSLMKSLMPGIHRCAISGIFSDNYLIFLTTLFELLSPQNMESKSQPSSPTKSTKPTFKETPETPKPTKTFMSTLYTTLQLPSASASSNLFDTILMDDKLLKMYKDILLSAFCYISESNSNELFKLLIKYKHIVFKQQLFNDHKFSSMWLHVTRPRGGTASERIEIMTEFMQMIDNSIMSTYSPTEIQTEFIQFKTSNQDIIFKENENRITKMNLIIETKQKMYSNAAKMDILSRIYRSTNFSIEQNMVIQSININQRQNERTVFEFSLLARKQLMQSKEFAPLSYHLSPVSFPVCQSRAMSPSPFPIKSPSPSEKVQKSFFMPYDDCSDDESADIPTLNNEIGNPDTNDNAEKAQPKRRKRFNENDQRIVAIRQRGLMNCSPEWCLFGCSEINRPFYSPFEYSAVIEQGPQLLLELFKTTFREYEPFNEIFDVNFFYFIHPLPSVLFITNNALLLVVLAKGALQLVSHPQNPVAFLPFTESVALCEFSQTSLFCGHVVIVMRFDKIVRLQRHFYIHQKVGLSISTLGAADIILLFSNPQEMVEASKMIRKKLVRRSYPPTNILFTLQNVQQSTQLWQNNVISNFDYLLLLNVFGGRSFADLSQYPVVPWVINPTTLEKRDLSLPMGQLNENRAKHYEQTYEMSSPLKYFYGFHYSLPGIVFWLLMRVPPFTFFQWDLNNGWDNSQRLFVSLQEAWTSAAVSNPSDLKELIPAVYQTPESFENSSHIQLGVADDVSLPSWSNNNPNYFTENIMKYMNESQQIHKWIDLIFGYKQTGDAAIEAKNVFLPSSYHNSTCEKVEMNKDVFRSQVLNFGQCPVQLFNKPHLQKKHKRIKQNWDDVLFHYHDSHSVEILNPLQLNLNTHLFSGAWLGGERNGTQVVILLPVSLLQNAKILKNKKRRQFATALSTALISFRCSGCYFYFDIDNENQSLSLFDDAYSNNIQTTTDVPLLAASAAASSSSSFTSTTNDESSLKPAVKSSSFSFAPFLSSVLNPSPNETVKHRASTATSKTLLKINDKPKSLDSNLKIGEKSETAISNEVELISMLRQPIFTKYSIDFQYANDLTVSNDGFILAVSYEFGRTDIFQIIFERGRPADLNKFSSFQEFGSICLMSAVYTQNFLCASIFTPDKKHFVAVIWNFATQMRHRSIALQCCPIQLAFDQFDGILTILSPNEISQYSPNAVFLRKHPFSIPATCMTHVGLDFSFDARLTIVGHVDGSISFLAVDRSTFEFIVVKRITNAKHGKKVGIATMNATSTIIPRVVAVDENGSVSLIEIDAFDENTIINKCSYCDNSQTSSCVQCKSPICESCRHDGTDFCKRCAHGVDYLNFTHF